MISYTRKSINILSLILSIIIFISINSLFQNINFTNQKKEIQGETISKEEIVQNEQNEQKQKEQEKQEEQIKEQQNQEKEKQQSQENTEEWSIEIPIISLKAEIAEGTGVETMNKYVGHFSETTKINGNVGLAAHNRGYPVNYFAKVKELKKGDEIHYKYRGEEKTYIVNVKEVIKDTDWKYLEQTNENKITLITCVEDAPMYRRCIQATQKKEDVE